MPNMDVGDALSWRRLHLSRAKLKASSRTSALLSGFAMVAMVEVQLENDKEHPENNVPDYLLVAFSVCTTLLVSVNMLALLISTCILPNIESVSSIPGISAVSESPHEKLHYYIEIAWAFSTVFGILLFLFEIAILCWVKFYIISPKAALGASVLLIPVVVLFIAFAFHFYRKLVAHKYECHELGIQELETMVNQLHSDCTEATPERSDNTYIV